MKLLTIEPIEGKAFFEEDGKVYHLRPLYGQGGIICTTKEQMQHVMASEGYEKIDLDFPNVKEIIEFVRGKYEECKGEEGLKVPNDEQLEEIVCNTGDNLLLDYIKRAVEKWIPEGNLKGAKRLLSDVMGFQNIKERVELFEAATNLASRIEDLDDTSVPVKIVDTAPVKINRVLVRTIWITRFPSFYQFYPDFEGSFLEFIVRKRAEATPFGMIGCRT